MTSVRAINARFHKTPYDAQLWASSGLLADAGVLIHVFDSQNGDADQKWLPTTGVGLLSASLVHVGQKNLHTRGIPTFNWGTTGVVLRPSFNKIVCACAGDCGGRCIGAYGQEMTRTTPLYCDDPELAPHHGQFSGCVYRPGPQVGDNGSPVQPDLTHLHSTSEAQNWAKDTLIHGLT